MALLVALVLVLGAAPGLAQEDDGIHSTKPAKRDYPHKANRVTIRFSEPLVEEGTEGKDPTITVQDECGRTLSSDTMAPEEPDWAERAFVMLDRRNKNPNGRYSVVVSYWLASDEGENSEDPDSEDPANQAPRIYKYWFRVHGGPNCEGTPKGGGHHGGNNNEKKKKRVWGGTSGNDHDDSDGHSESSNLRTAGSTSGTGSTHTDTDFGSYTSPTLSSDDDHTTNHTGSSMTPFGEEDFGDPFGDATGTSPLSNPTDPSLYESEAGQIPEEAEDQQTLSAAPTDDLGPESGTLVVALVTALLMGVGGGLFLRKTEPPPIRTRS